MNRHNSPIDARPFQAKASLQLQQDLQAKYRRIAIEEVVAALHHLRAAADNRSQPTAKAA